MKKIGVVLVLMLIFITGCGNKTMVSIDLDSFEKISKSHNFTVADNMETYNNIDYIDEAMISVYNDITVEMIVYDTDENASKVHSSHIDSFNLLKSTGASEKKHKGTNYYKYVLISNGYYMVSSRIDNTLIFCKTALGNKNAVEKLFSELGY